MATKNLAAPLQASAPTNFAAGAGNLITVVANPKRAGLVITNTHATQTASLGFGAAAVSLSGITIMAGGTYTMTEYTMYRGNIYSIASGAATNLSIMELTA